MNNSNGNVKTPYDKRLNYTATGVLLIWILIVVFGIFSLINAVLLFKMPVLWVWVLSLFNPLNPFLIVVFIIGFFPSRSVSISLIKLFKNKRWIEPSKFIKGILIELVAASIASILTIIFYAVNNLTDFFSLFFSFTFLFSIQFLLFSLYYYRNNFPEPQIYRNQRYTRF